MKSEWSSRTVYNKFYLAANILLLMVNSLPAIKIRANDLNF